jgi:hypothetical protein
MHRLFHLIILLPLIALLSACGGGEKTSDSAGVTLSLSTSKITPDQPATLTVSTRDGSNQPVSATVTLSSSNGKVELSRESVTTDSSGEASVLVTYVSAGRDTILASATIGGTDYAKSVSIEVSSEESTPQYSLDIVFSNDPPVLSEGSPLSAEVTLKDVQGNPISGAMLLFSANLATFSNLSNGRVLTDAQGKASVTLEPGDAFGADILKVQYLDPNTLNLDEPDVLIEKAVAFTVQQGQINQSSHAILMSDIALGVSSISYGGTTTASVTFYEDSNDNGVVDVGTDLLYTASPISVSFTSQCASESKASMDSPVISLNGVASSTYETLNCEGNDLITATASVNNSTLTKSTTLTIQPSNLGSITFEKADPQVIYIKGSGGVEASRVTFNVFNDSGFPMRGQTVVFSLSTEVGGVTLSQSQALTNSDGQVSITVNSGSIATPVRVTAKVLDANGNATDVQTQSSVLTIATGMPDQAHISLAASVSNPEAWNYPGEEVSITAYLADANGNPVLDGTTVNFKTESGLIDSSCTTFNGTCTVTWRSGNEQNRPIDHRTTILAYALGSEYFHDKDGDGIMSSADGEPWDNKTSSGLKQIYVRMPSGDYHLVTLNNVLDEPFRDENGNGLFDEPFDDQNGDGLYSFGERFIDYNLNGKYDGAGNNPVGEVNYLDISGDGKYQGGGVLFSEWFNDLNFNNTHDTDEEFWDRQDGYGFSDGVYDNGYQTFTDATGSHADYAGLEAFSNLDGSADGFGNPTFNAPGFSDLSEPWLDKDENGVRSEDEEFIDYDENGLFSLRNAKYDGFNCQTSDAICGAANTYVRRALPLVMASSHLNYVVKYLGGGTGCSPNDVVASNLSSVSVTCTGLGVADGGVASFSIYFSDSADQVPPEGTVVASEADVGDMTVLDYTVPNSHADQGVTLSFVIKDSNAGDTDPAESGTVSVTMTTPKGTETKAGFSISVD